MAATINAKQLRASLPRLVEQVRKGARFTVIYRSRPAFQIVPVDETATSHLPLESDSLYRAKPVGRSADGRSSSDHDEILYER
jgi:antitoxin (DNA-binding transcriptional repressor) of toxin-antitoxin stability system